MTRETTNTNDNPLDRFIGQQGHIVLDGGLATALESRGHDLNDTLWSAKILIENPAAIRDLHFDYFKAGADCTTTATYQASRPGFAARGINDDQATDLMRQAVQLAVDAREEFWADEQNRIGRLKPIVAASIGPYGAYLADGSEYTGNYGVSDAELREFHHQRWQLLASTAADLLACETIPSASEADVLLALLRENPQTWAWLSFSCRDKSRLCDGTPLKDVALACADVPNVAAVGINCTDPEYVESLVAELRRSTDKPIIVYPNLGEIYDGQTKTWSGGPSADDWLGLAKAWGQAGASGIGGCCRIGPEIICALRRARDSS